MIYRSHDAYLVANDADPERAFWFFAKTGEASTLGSTQSFVAHMVGAEWRALDDDDLVRVQGPRVTVVQQRTWCGSRKTTPADTRRE
jgi:hypothetical protein